MPLSLHKYLYANANPVNFTDPSGRETLASLQVSQSISNQQRRTQVQNFVRTTRRLSKFTGRAYQYLGALFSTIAAVEFLENKRPAKIYFGNIPLASNPAFEASVLGFFAYNLAKLSVSMFSQQANYEVEAIWAGGKLVVCKANEYALAVAGKFVSDGMDTIVLCGNFAGVPPLPRTTAAVVANTFSKVSGMGIMVHEWAHLVLKAIDDEYFCAKARSLPANRQSKNADNYRCAVETYAVLAAKDLVDDLLGP